MKNELSIEFGSANLRIYKRNEGMIYNQPNAVVYKTIKDEQMPVAFGKEAKQQEGKLAENESLIFPVVNGILNDMDAQLDILKYVLSNNLCVNLTTAKIIIVISSGCKTDEIENFKKLMKNMEVKEFHIVFQPLATYQLLQANNQPQMIVDIGAGKSEVSILHNGEILKSVRLDLGGNIMNLGVREILRVEKGLITTSSVIEKLKTTIGSLFSTDNASLKVWAQNRVTFNGDNYLINACDINPAFIDTHEKIWMLIHAMLADSTPEIVSAISQRGIVFVGDSSKIIGIKKYYESKLKIKIRVLEHYGDASVIGASLLFKQFHNRKLFII